MIYIEHRRHAERNKPSPNLSHDGVSAARQAGGTMGKFDYVVTSSVPRAQQTAAALGFGIDETSDDLASLVGKIEHELEWENGFGSIYSSYLENPKVKHFGEFLKQFVLDTVENMNDDSRLLIVSHGGIAETCVIGCTENPEIADWGDQLSYCEGVSFQYDNGRFINPSVLRV